MVGAYAEDDNENNQIGTINTNTDWNYLTLQQENPFKNEINYPLWIETQSNLLLFEAN